MPAAAPVHSNVAAVTTIKRGCKRTIHLNGRMVRWAKTSTKVSRYKAKGTTHRKGIGGSSPEMYVVTPISRLEGTNERASQRRRRGQGWD